MESHSVLLTFEEAKRLYYSNDASLREIAIRAFGKRALESSIYGKPRTWEDIENDSGIIPTASSISLYSKDPSIEIAAQAFIKLCQLIKIGYGGIPTMWERMDNIVFVPRYFRGNKWECTGEERCINPIAFHKREQCLEFISHPKNIELLNEFYGIPT